MGQIDLLKKYSYSIGQYHEKCKYDRTMKAIRKSLKNNPRDFAFPLKSISQSINYLS